MEKDTMFLNMEEIEEVSGIDIPEIAMENDYDEQEAIAKQEFLEEFGGDDSDELAATAFGY